MSGKRKKTDEEKQQARLRNYTSVICKLATLDVDADLTAEIRHRCLVLKRIQMEAWHIAILHVLHCLDQDLEMPNLDQTFFLRCCEAARARGFGQSRHVGHGVIVEGHQIAPPRKLDEHLRETVRLYRAGREATEGFIPPEDIRYESNSINSMAAQMRANAENMVVLHFEKRLALYIRLRLEDGPTLTAPNEEVQRLVCACYRRADAEFSDEEQRLRNRLGLSPYENVIKDNLEHFIKKLHQILIKVETSQRWSPEKKGVRAFSLLPFSSSFAAAHIVINGSTLHGFCARMFEEAGAIPHDRKNPLGIPLSKTG
jgi:hypothetical protein